MTRRDYTLLTCKNDGDVKCTLTDFGMATGEIEWPGKVAAKDLGEIDCPGESGVRVYFPDVLPLEAYDLDVEFKCRVEDERLYDYFSNFRDYLTGNDGEGTELKIYSPMHGIGRRGVWMKEMSDISFQKDNIGEYASMTVTFRVSDPETDITLVKQYSI